MTRWATVTHMTRCQVVSGKMAAVRVTDVAVLDVTGQRETSLYQVVCRSRPRSNRPVTAEHSNSHGTGFWSTEQLGPSGVLVQRRDHSIQLVTEINQTDLESNTCPLNHRQRTATATKKNILEKRNYIHR